MVAGADGGAGAGGPPTGGAPGGGAPGDLEDVVLEGPLGARRAPAAEQERDGALYDLLQSARMRPAPGAPGAPGAGEGAPGPPFVLAARAEEGGLRLSLRAPGGAEAASARLPLSALRGCLRDYETVCGGYYEAIRTASSQRIEALDMARRALHDEGARRVAEALAGRIETDGETDRRLFSLLFALRPRAPGASGGGGEGP